MYARVSGPLQTTAASELVKCEMFYGVCATRTSKWSCREARLARTSQSQLLSRRFMHVYRDARRRPSLRVFSPSETPSTDNVVQTPSIRALTTDTFHSVCRRHSTTALGNPTRVSTSPSSLYRVNSWPELCHQVWYVSRQRRRRAAAD